MLLLIPQARLVGLVLNDTFCGITYVGISVIADGSVTSRGALLVYPGITLKIICATRSTV